MDARTRSAARPARILMMASPERARDFGPIGPAGTTIIHGRVFLRQEMERTKIDHAEQRRGGRRPRLARRADGISTTYPDGPSLLGPCMGQGAERVLRTA